MLGLGPLVWELPEVLGLGVGTSNLVASKAMMIGVAELLLIVNERVLASVVIFVVLPTQSNKTSKPRWNHYDDNNHFVSKGHQ